MERGKGENNSNNDSVSLSITHTKKKICYNTKNITLFYKKGIR